MNKIISACRLPKSFIINHLILINNPSQNSFWHNRAEDSTAYCTVSLTVRKSICTAGFTSLYQSILFFSTQPIYFFPLYYQVIGIINIGCKSLFLNGRPHCLCAYLQIQPQQCYKATKTLIQDSASMKMFA